MGWGALGPSVRRRAWLVTAGAAVNAIAASLPTPLVTDALEVAFYRPPIVALFGCAGFLFGLDALFSVRVRLAPHRLALSHERVFCACEYAVRAHCGSTWRRLECRCSGREALLGLAPCRRRSGSERVLTRTTMAVTGLFGGGRCDDARVMRADDHWSRHCLGRRWAGSESTTKSGPGQTRLTTTKEKSDVTLAEDNWTLRPPDVEVGHLPVPY